MHSAFFNFSQLCTKSNFILWTCPAYSRGYIYCFCQIACFSITVIIKCICFSNASWISQIHPNGHCSGIARALSGHCLGIVWALSGHCLGIARALSRALKNSKQHFNWALMPMIPLGPAGPLIELIKSFKKINLLKCLSSHYFKTCW